MTKQAGHPARRKTLVIHIGDHKTGTTTIQNAFASGAVRIDGAELSYPCRLNHNYLMGHITAFAKETEPPEIKNDLLGLPEIGTHLKETDATYTVLSGEVFENIKPGIFVKLIDTYFRDHVDEVKIIAYVRPHAQRILSSFVEQNKIGWFRGSMQEFFERNLERRRFHYKGRFRHWRSLFGEAFTLRPMIRSELRGQSVLEDFCHTAFDGQPVQIAPFRDENRSLDLRDMVLIRFLQGHFQNKDKWLRHTLGWEMARRIGQAPVPGRTVEKVAMARSLADAIAETYEEDAAAVDADFFDDRPLLRGALADMQQDALVEPQSLVAEDYYDPEELRNLTVMAAILSDMLSVSHAWPAHFHRHRVLDLLGGSEDI